MSISRVLILCLFLFWFVVPSPGQVQSSLPFGQIEMYAAKKDLWSRLGLRKNTQSMPIAIPIPQTGQYPSPLVPVPAEWRFSPELSDEFWTKGVNSEKWFTQQTSWGGLTWDPHNTFQRNGQLSLRMVYEPHQQKDRTAFYKSGILRSQAAVTIGYFEARIKGCHHHPGVTPAFWLANLKTGTGREVYSEIDIVELQQHSGIGKGVSLMDFNLHAKERNSSGEIVKVGPDTHPDLCKHRWKAPFDPRQDFHIYAAYVSNEQITWYVDGRRIAQAANRNWHLPMRIVLSLELRQPYITMKDDKRIPNPAKSSPRGFPTTMEVDYVRVWAPPSSWEIVK